MQKEKQMWIICCIILVVCFMGVLSLKGNITGYIVEETLLTKDMITALDSLLEAEEDILELKNLNLSTYFLNDQLLEAKKSFLGNDYTYLKSEFNKIQDKSKYDYSQILLEDFSKILPGEHTIINYSKSIELTTLIIKTKKKALELRDKLTLLEEKETKARKDKVNTEKSLGLLNQARKSFDEERYDEAEELLVNAENELSNASREYLRLVILSRNFFQRYWWQSILIIIILTIIGVLTFKKTRIIRAKKKLNKYKMELKVLKELMKKIQIDRFRTGKLSESMYKIKMDKYKTKLNKIRTEIPVLESIAHIKKKIKKVKKIKRGIITIKK